MTGILRVRSPACNRIPKLSVKPRMEQQPVMLRTYLADPSSAAKPRTHEIYGAFEALGRWSGVLLIAMLGTGALTSRALGAQNPAGQRGAGAGRGGQAPAPQNLQVLAKDTPPAQVLQTMQTIAAALGVQCG